MNLIDELEKLGEQEVRKRLASNVYGDPRNLNYISVQAWLRSKEVEREEALNDESLSISRKALVASEEANRLACEANAVAREANNLARSSDKTMRREVRKDRIIAITAIIIAIIAAHKVIWSLIVWIGNIIKNP